jgi:serine protease Do
MPRLERQTAYGVLLAIIAIAILVIGYLLRPQRAEDKKQPANEITAVQAEVERLRQIAEQNQSRATTSRFAAAANGAATHLVYAPSLRRSGIVWGEDGSVLLPSDGQPPQPSIAIEAAGKQAISKPLTWGAGLNFLIARAAGLPDVSPPNFAAANSLTPGSWIVDVGLDSGGVQLRPGNFGGTSRVRCGDSTLLRLMMNIPLDSTSIGTGLFDLNGDLVGVVTKCDDVIMAVPTFEVSGALAPAKDPVQGPLLHAGMHIEEIPPDWQPILRSATGLVVTEVWQGWPAEGAGIVPGDVIVSMNGQPIQKTADLSSALQSGADVQLTLSRQGRRVSVTLSSAANSSTTEPEVSLQRPAGGVQLKEVRPGSGASQAGLLPGDRILSINGIPATPARVMRRFSSPDPKEMVLVQVQRDALRFLAEVAP